MSRKRLVLPPQREFNRTMARRFHAEHSIVSRRAQHRLRRPLNHLHQRKKNPHRRRQAQLLRQLLRVVQRRQHQKKPLLLRLRSQSSSSHQSKLFLAQRELLPRLLHRPLLSQLALVNQEEAEEVFPTQLGMESLAQHQVSEVFYCLSGYSFSLRVI